VIEYGLARPPSRAVSAPFAPVPPRADGTPVPRRSLPLGPLALALVAGSVLLAAGLGYAFGLWMGVGEPWVAGLAASLGMAATALPLGALLLGLARAAEPAAVPAPAGTVPVAGAMAREPFLELAEREWARSRRYGSGAALLLVEVDHWPRLLEQPGRAGALAVLREIVHDTAPTLRGADALACFAEGQLAVFLAHADATGALDVAERIRERTEMLEVPHQTLRLRATVSVGVAHLRPAHLHLQALIEDASDAVAAARQAGGNCVRAAPVELGRVLGGEVPPPAQPDRRARKP
jgi:diguanylate cyclase (GGDEF)-like protein